MMERWPDFFLVGAMKAGTTSLYDLLGEHPDLYLPREKEPFYFLWPDGQGAGRFRVPHRRGFIGADSWVVIRTRRQYQDLFRRAGPDQLTGEASTFYLPDPHVAERIRACVPRARIIAILRDPVDRAYSAYMFQRSLGVEPARSFEAAIEAERRGDRDDWLYGWRHLYCSAYSRQLQRYFREFGEDRVLVVDFDDLRRDPHALARRIFTFLGIDPAVDLSGRPPSNRTAIPVNPWAARAKALLARPNVVKDTVKHVLPRSLRRDLRHWGLALVDRFSAPPPPMTARERDMLGELFRPDLERLQRMLGRSFAGWVNA